MTDTAGHDRPNTIPWPPLLYAAVLAGAYGLNWLKPLAPLAMPPVSTLLGWPLVIMGVCFGVAAIIRFRILGTPIEPTGRPTRVATAGVYRFSRNPMYLGAVAALFGVGLVAHWTWLIVLTLFLPFALYHLAIKREEAYLSKHFGADYDAYRSRVRRWL